jgi:hypothetical protein
MDDLCVLQVQIPFRSAPAAEHEGEYACNDQKPTNNIIMREGSILGHSQIDVVPDQSGFQAMGLHHAEADDGNAKENEEDGPGTFHAGVFSRNYDLP